MRTRTACSRLITSAVAGVVAVTALAACSGGADSAASSAGSEVRSAAGGVPDQGGADTSLSAPEADPGAGATAAGSVVDPAALERKVTRRADLTVRVDDVGTAAARVRTIAATAGGLVVSEDISSDPVQPSPTPLQPETATDVAPSPVRTSGGTITVSVPADRLDATLDRLAEVGEVLARHTSTDDVTARYVDTESRVDSARASVERVRALMSKATKLADVVTLEAELSRRQADLEALESQLATLKGQVALSPVTVHLETRTVPPATGDDTGFLAGLAAGWRAFTASVTVLLTLVGALVPFLAAAAVVLVPALLWWRRRPRGPVPAAGPPPAPPTTPAT